VEGNGVPHPFWQTFPSGRVQRVVIRGRLQPAPTGHCLIVAHLFGVNHAPRSFYRSPSLLLFGGGANGGAKAPDRAFVTRCCNMGQRLGLMARCNRAVRCLLQHRRRWRIQASNMLAVHLAIRAPRSARILRAILSTALHWLIPSAANLY
jgi:hypothetical protein